MTGLPGPRTVPRRRIGDTRDARAGPTAGGLTPRVPQSSARPPLAQRGSSRSGTTTPNSIDLMSQASYESSQAIRFMTGRSRLLKKLVSGDPVTGRARPLLGDRESARQDRSRRDRPRNDKRRNGDARVRSASLVRDNPDDRRPPRPPRPPADRTASPLRAASPRAASPRDASPRAKSGQEARLERVPTRESLRSPPTDADGRSVPTMSPSPRNDRPPGPDLRLPVALAEPVLDAPGFGHVADGEVDEASSPCAPVATAQTLAWPTWDGRPVPLARPAVPMVEWRYVPTPAPAPAPGPPVAPRGHMRVTASSTDPPRPAPRELPAARADQLRLLYDLVDQLLAREARARTELAAERELRKRQEQQLDDCVRQQHELQYYKQSCQKLHEECELYKEMAARAQDLEHQSWPGDAGPHYPSPT